MLQGEEDTRGQCQRIWKFDCGVVHHKADFKALCGRSQLFEEKAQGVSINCKGKEKHSEETPVGELLLYDRVVREK
ncbi:hypothetical protein GDO81_008592 [Engystomops pustulosus]|uniref:Uncharacterized protein n=1 Tax=Engystomops pustulosus TaxID=76066 RepID=A0AAV7CGV0_ENGPU|nr:hypothetical protein GDO81_008592 [Engystomops pustulosus]